MKKNITLFLLFLAGGNIFASIADFFLANVSDSRREVLEYALDFKGTPYVWGGTTPLGFDCSGFVYYVFNNGINYPLSRNSEEQYKVSIKIDDNDREPGDLIFFKDLKPGKISHVGIYYGLYMGDDSNLYGKEVFLSAVSDGPRTGIEFASTDENYWQTHFLGYGRVLNGSPQRYIAAANINTKNGEKAKAYKVARADSKTKKQSSPSDDFTPISRGRKGFYLTADMEMQKMDFSKDNFKPPYVNNIYISYIGNIGKHFFYGITGGMDTLTFTQTPLFSIGLEGGANIQIANFLIPYVEIGATLKTDQKLGLKVGGGIDIKISRLILTAGYDYTFPFSIAKLQERDFANSKLTNFHSLSFGIGYAL